MSEYRNEAAPLYCLEGGRNKIPEGGVKGAVGRAVERKEGEEDRLPGGG